MGLLDGNDDWMELVKKQFPEMAGLLGTLEPSAKDRQSALTSSLMQAGAAMLAGNNGRGPGINAIGQGALAGLQGYQGALDSNADYSPMVAAA